MPLVVRVLSAASFALALIAGAGTFVIMVIVAADVTLRFLGGGVPGTLEIVTYYLMLMVAFLPLARVERLDAAITVDLAYTLLRPIAQRGVTLFIAALSTCVYGTIAYLTWLDAVRHAGTRAYATTVFYDLPVWPAYFILPAAFALAATVTFLRIFEASGTWPLPPDPIGDPGGTEMADLAASVRAADR
jgi:TRAP-type C4-dicarboxylate transport system permease small subunit